MKNIEKFDPLTEATIKILESKIADLNDQTRYLVVSVIGSMKLFYCIQSNTYVMNRINEASRIKNLKVAEATRNALSDGRKEYLEIWKVKESKSKKTVKFIEKVL